MKSIFERFKLLPLVLPVLLCACQENPPDFIIPQFNRPQDVALVCFDLQSQVSLPYDCCKKTNENSGPLVEDYCDSTDENRVVLAFITQTTFGEVAVVNLSTGGIIDQDAQIPYNSFVPVGGQPSDITASFDGTRIYTSNFGTEDLSVIDVSKSFGPSLVSAKSVGVSGPAAKIAIATAPSIRDRFAFVTQPTLGRLAIVELPGDGDDPDTTEDDIVGQLLGYMRLGSNTGLNNAPADLSDDGIQPWSLVISKNDFTNHSLFVSGKNGHYVMELDTEVLVDRALALSEVGEVGDEAIVKRIELDDFTVRTMSMEPGLERWIYAVENELGGVLVIDLVAGEILPVNIDNPLMSDAYSIELPGIARAITMVALGETNDYPGPLTFNGVFGVVSTTQNAVFIIDAEDRDALDESSIYQHSLRSSMDWIDDEKYEELLATAAPQDSGVNLDESDWTSYPELENEPVLEADEQILSETTADGIAMLESADAGVGECDDNNDTALFGGLESHGFHFRCDARMSSTESWALTWEGDIGVSGSAVVHWELVKEDGQLPVTDVYKNFCAAGVLGSEDGDDFSDIYEGVGGLENYEGDLLEITSEPTLTAEGEQHPDCASYTDLKTIYRIAEILDDDTIVIKALDREDAAPLPNMKCFGQIFTYKIRAQNHWTLRGSWSGYMKRGETDTWTGQCLPYLLNAELEKKRHGKNFRVFPGVDFYNNYFTFKLIDGILADKSLVDVIRFLFQTSNGFTPLYSPLGNDITDIEIAPNNEMILIDQASNGLIRFDMVDNFSIIGDPIN